MRVWKRIASSKFYGTPYSVESLAGRKLAWQRLPDTAIDPRLSLPGPNPFIAEDVELSEIVADNPPVPALVEEGPLLKLWFRQDDRFRIPKGGIFSSFRSPQVSGSARNAAASLLYVSLLNDSVNEYVYPAQLAGLNFSLYRHSRGISLQVRGYTDKQLVLLNDIVGRIRAAEMDTPRFPNLRADLVRNLENVSTNRPFSQVMSDARRLLQHGEYSEEQLLAELRQLGPTDVAAFADAFWSSARAEVLLNGNYAPGVVDGVVSALRPLLPQRDPGGLQPLQVVKLAPGGGLVYSAPVEHGDSVLFLYVQAPGEDLHQRAMAALTGQVFKSGFYQQLRTEQQLGYVVSAFYYPISDVPGVAMLVQSPGTPAPQVKQAVEAFLQETGTREGMTKEQFDKHRTALLSELRKPHKNLWEESDYFWKSIANRELAFDSREQLARAVEAIEYEPWRDWYRQSLLEQPASVAVVAPGRWDELPEGTLLESVQQLQSGRPYYERP